jgi:hypothetical protein
MSDIIDINVTPTIEQVEIAVTENVTTVNINTVQQSQDPNAVHKSGDETIDGVKTFVDSPIVPTATTSGQAVNFGQMNLQTVLDGGNFSNKGIEIETINDVSIRARSVNDRAALFEIGEGNENNIVDFGVEGAGFKAAVTHEGKIIGADATEPNQAVMLGQLNLQNVLDGGNTSTKRINIFENDEVAMYATSQSNTAITAYSLGGVGVFCQSDYNVSASFELGEENTSEIVLFNVNGVVKAAIQNDGRITAKAGISSDDVVVVSQLDNVVASVELLSNKNQNNGYCGLDSGGKVPLENLPTTLLKYQGVWNASTNTPTLTSPDLTKVGNVYNVSVAGTRFGIAFNLGDWLIYNAIGVPEKSDNSDDVVSVNGQTGVVTITKSDVGLSNVDNTTDLNKPVSTAQQIALNSKANLANPTFTGSVQVPPATAPNEAVNLSQLANENNVYLSHEFLSAANSQDFAIVSANSGTTSAGTPTTNNVGVHRLNSSTTANSGVGIRSSSLLLRLKGNEVFTYIFNPLTFANTTSRLGFHDSTSSSIPANGVFFRYSGNGDLTLVTADNSIQTTSATIATLTTNTWYKVRFTVNANATSVLGELFNASGTLIASVTQTTNIPNNTRALNICAITTNSGTTATALIDVDFISAKLTLTR